MFSLVIKFSRVKQSKFIRNVITVASGTAGAQAIALICMPFIARIYGPEVLGLAGVFIALLAIVNPMAALTYPLAIVLPENDDESRVLARLSLIVALIISVISALAIIFAGDWFVATFKLYEIANYLLLIPISMLLYTFYQVVEQSLIRYGEFKRNAKVSVFHSFLINILKLVVGLYHPVALVLILIASITNGLRGSLLYFRRKSTHIFMLERTNQLSLWAVANKYKDFAIFRAPEVAINAASQGLPILMLGTYYGPASAGFYTLGKTVLALPTSLIGKSVGDVFYPRISKAAFEKESLYKLVREATLLLATVGFIPFFIIFLFGPVLFSFVFGSEWAVAGEYASWLSVWLFFLFLNNPAVKAIPVLRLQGAMLTYTIITIGLRILVLYLSYTFYSDDVITVAIFCISGGLLNILLICIVLLNCKKFDSRR